MELMALASAVNQEEQRYVCEEFESNKELSLYDMLFRDENIKEDIKDKKVHSKPVKENKKLIEKAYKDKNYETIALKVDVTQPKIKTEDLKSIDSVLAGYSTTFNIENASGGENIWYQSLFLYIGWRNI